MVAAGVEIQNATIVGDGVRIRSLWLMSVGLGLSKSILFNICVVGGGEERTFMGLSRVLETSILNHNNSHNNNHTHNTITVTITINPQIQQHGCVNRKKNKLLNYDKGG